MHVMTHYWFFGELRWCRGEEVARGSALSVTANNHLCVALSKNPGRSKFILVVMLLLSRALTIISRPIPRMSAIEIVMNASMVYRL